MLAGFVCISAALAVAGWRIAIGNPVQARTNLLLNSLPLPNAIIAANNSPELVRNPRRAGNVVLVHRIDRPTFSAAVQWSADAGGSWHETALPLPAGKDRPYGPDAAFAPDGTLYVVYANLVGVGNVPQSLWVSTSRDGGRSFSAPVHVSGLNSYQARIAVDHSGTVFITWMQARDVGLYRIVALPSPIVEVHSRDGARTFSAPVVVSDAQRERVGVATPVIDSRGDLVVLYEDFKKDVRDFEDLDGPAWDQPFALVLTRSSDGGRSFFPGREVDSSIIPAHRFLVFLPEFPSISAGFGGKLYVAWSDARNGDEDVFLSASSDAGRTWSGPVRVNDNRIGDRTAQYLPTVEAAPDGRIDVVFLDRRNDPRNVMTDTYLATSYDGGRSFANNRISTNSFSSLVGPVANAHLPVDFGSRLGLLSSDDGALSAWTDTRSGSVDTGRQEVAVAQVNIHHISWMTQWPAVLALLALGVVAITTAPRSALTDRK